TLEHAIRSVTGRFADSARAATIAAASGPLLDSSSALQLSGVCSGKASFQRFANFNRQPAKLNKPAEVSLLPYQPAEQQMTSIVHHLNQVSIFGSALALFVILGFSWGFTLIHVLQEWKGEVVPLWRVFGAVVGVWIPNWLGFALFTLGLTVILWGVSLAGISRLLPFRRTLAVPATVRALGGLIGPRVPRSGL